MPYRALFLAAVIAGTSYAFAGALGAEGVGKVMWKGAGVGLLAAWAALCARDRDGWLIAATLALGALGDVLLAAVGLVVGAVAFLAGHGVAVWLYARNRGMMTAARTTGACVILVATPVLAASLPADRAAVPGVALYALGLGAMAACAWASRFPRRVATGALLFVASDLLIFAEQGPLSASMLPALLIWPLYFVGQALIAYGVVTARVVR